MKSLVIFMILFPMVVFAQASGQPAPSKNETPSLPAGYATKDCDKKCTKSQQCTLKAEDERYYCTNLNPSAKTPKPLEVYISCKSIGGIQRSQCSSREIVISAISGKNQIPIHEDKPGQCCIAKSKLKVY
jgi:hypothetical protein